MYSQHDEENLNHNLKIRNKKCDLLPDWLKWKPANTRCPSWGWMPLVPFGRDTSSLLLNLTKLPSCHQPGPWRIWVSHPCSKQRGPINRINQLFMLKRVQINPYIWFKISLRNLKKIRSSHHIYMNTVFTKVKFLYLTAYSLPNSPCSTYLPLTLFHLISTHTL